MTGYKKTTTGPDGKVELDVFTNLGYDEFENMIHYDREATDFKESDERGVGRGVRQI